MPLRNLPTDVATSLAQMIDIRPSQVSSMALTRNAGFDLTLLAFAPGESVSEEEYFTFTTEESEKLEVQRIAGGPEGSLEGAIRRLAEKKREEQKQVSNPK